MLHFEFRIQLENQSSSLNPAQKAVAARLSGMSDENGDHGRLEVQTRQKPRGTDCEYTMLSQSTMVCPTNYAKNSKLKRQQIKTEKLLGPLLYLFLIYDTFLNNLIVMAVNPVQTKLFPLTSSCREKKGEGVGGGGGLRRAPFYTLRPRLWRMIRSPKLHRIMCSTFLIKIYFDWRNDGMHTMSSSRHSIQRKFFGGWGGGRGREKNSSGLNWI